MEIKSESRNLRLTTRKARLVIDLVRGKDTSQALDLLHVTNHKAAPMIVKTLKSAIANARNRGINGDLYISKAYINAGPIIKRMEPRARGRANVIHKKISHITVFVSERSK